jgi:uncharacterized protein (TIGR03437 family)
VRLLSFSLLLYTGLALAANALAAGTVGFSYPLPDPEAVINAVAVDAVGNTYLTGSTISSTFPTTPGVFQPKYAGNPVACGVPSIPMGYIAAPCSNAFVLKLDPTGAVVWASYLGGAGSAVGAAIAVDASGNVYVAGNTSSDFEVSNNFPTTAGSAFPTSQSATNGFMSKISPDGSQLLYSTYLPGLDGSAMAIDSAGNAYILGNVYNSQAATAPIPTTPGAFQTSSNAARVAAIIKLNAAGSALVYATYLGGRAASDLAQAQGIAVDASGNAYVAGYVDGPTAQDFPVTAGAYQTVSGVTTAFVTKLNASGSGLVYSTFLGSNAVGLAIKVDSQGRAYILGNGTVSTTPGAFEPSATPPPVWTNYAEINVSETDFTDFPQSSNPPTTFLASLSANGSSLVYATYVTGAGTLDIDAAGDAYVAGNAVSGFPITSGAFEQCYNGNYFAAEFSPAGALLGATYFGGPATGPDVVLAVGLNGLVSVGAGAPQNGGEVPPPNVYNSAYNFLINNPQQQGSPCVSPMVQNAAAYYTYGTSVSAGELVTLQGAGIGPEIGVSGSPGASGLLPTNLAGVQVFFDQYAAPLMYAQAGQINVQVPWEIAGQTSTKVQVIYNNTMVSPITFTVQPAVPGLFYLSYPSHQAAILNQDGTVNSPNNPANGDDIIALFGTGGGPTTPAGVTGAIWGPGTDTRLMEQVTVTIGYLNAQVVYAGAAPGLPSAYFQINVRVPILSSLAAGIAVQIGSAYSLDYQTVAVLQ